MKQPIVKRKTSKTQYNGYVFSDIDISLTRNDTDIEIHLPSGKNIVLQFRTEGPSIDICVGDPMSNPPETWEAINWIGPDMEPAPCAHRKKEIRKVNQICFDISKKDYFGA